MQRSGPAARRAGNHSRRPEAAEQGIRRGGRTVNRAGGSPLPGGARDAGEGSARNLPPPTKPTYSTNRLNKLAVEPGPALLTGGALFNETRLCSAFAILMDLMREATDPDLGRAKPACVHDTAKKFTELMEEFAADRAKQSSWVIARQMLPQFVQHFKNTRSKWPFLKVPYDDAKRVRLPPQLSAEQRAALETQRDSLVVLVKSFGHNPTAPTVQAFVKKWLVSGDFIKANTGAKHVAAGAAADLALLGDPLSGSTILHYESKKTHIERRAAEDPFQYYLPPGAANVSADKVPGSLDVARWARAFYLRYLIREEMWRALGPAYYVWENFGGDIIDIAVAERLGLAPSAYSLRLTATTATIEELTTWLKSPEPKASRTEES